MSLLRPTVLTFGFAFGYVGTAEFSRSLSLETGDVAAFWLPGGLYLAALLIASPSRWPALVAAAVAADLLCDVLLHGRSLAVGVGFATANSLEALGAAWFLQRSRRHRFDVSRVQDMIRLTVAGACSTAIGALIGTTTAAIAFQAPFLTSWPVWWSVHFVGVLLVVPFALALRHRGAKSHVRLSGSKAVEFAILVAGTVAVGEAVFGARLPGIHVFPGAVFPVFLWAALRCGPLTVSTLLLIGSLIVVTRTAQGLGPFGAATLSPSQRVITSQLFLGIGTISFLILAALTKERRRALEALRQSEERLQLALSSSRLALWDWDVPSGQLYVSENWAEMIGTHHQRSHFPLDELAELVHPDDATRVEAHLQDVLRGRAPAFDLEYRVRAGHGSYTWIHTKGRVTTRDAQGHALRLAGTNDNITFRKVAEEELYRRATRDPVTGLWNRSVFLDRLQQAASRCERSSVGIAVCYLDVDNFKSINDRFGHAAGDELLKQFSARLSRFVRRSDTFARVGGDEFAVLLESVWKPEDLHKVCQSILEELRPAFALGSHSVLATTSIGAAWCRGRSGISAASLLDHADRAMYEAKRDGRNRFSIVPAA